MQKTLYIYLVRTPLFYAIRNKKYDAIKYLLYNNCEPWFTDDYSYKKLCNNDHIALYYINRARKVNIS